MSHLLVPTTPFRDGGEFPFDGSNLSQLLATLIIIASFGSLVAVLSVSLIRIFAGEPLNPFGVGPIFPPTLLAFGAGYGAAPA
jgi:hypothetical protein